MKSVLLLTKNFPPTNIVGAFRPFRLVKHLESRGVHCQVITRLPDPGAALDAHHLKELTGLTSIHYLYKKTSFTGPGIDSAFVKASPVNRGRTSSRFSLFKRLQGTVNEINSRWIRPDPDLLHVPAYLLKAIKLKALRPPQVLVTTSPPHSIHVAGLMLSKFWRIPLVVDFRDPWDSIPFYKHNGIRGRGLKSRVSHHLKHWIVNHADAVISSTQTYSQILINQGYTRDTRKFHTVTNCFDTNLAAVAAAKDPERFIISYVGIFYPDKDPYAFFRALRTWLVSLDSEKENFVKQRLLIRLIGSGDRSTQRQVADLGLNDVVRFIDRVPHDEAVRLLRGSDMALISTGLGQKTRPGWLPSKLFEYLGCRVPILAVTPEGEAANVIRQTDSGYVVTTEDHSAIGSILDIELNRKFDDNSRKAGGFSFSGVENFEESNVMAKMVGILESTTATGSGNIKSYPL